MKYTQFPQTDLKLFIFGISPVIFAVSLPVLRERYRTLPLTERNEGHGGYVV